MVPSNQLLFTEYRLVVVAKRSRCFFAFRELVADKAKIMSFMFDNLHVLSQSDPAGLNLSEQVGEFKGRGEGRCTDWSGAD